MIIFVELLVSGQTSVRRPICCMEPVNFRQASNMLWTVIAWLFLGFLVTAAGGVWMGPG